MKFQKITTLLIVCVLFGVVLSQINVADAARILSETPREDHHGVDYVDPYSIVYQKAKESVSCWLGKLSSGPSPSGPGH
uniref:Transmembrane protein n=1 Tax=Cucumis melo TaxID=3656 RepID=A0A9I9EF23_CUCME